MDGGQGSPLCLFFYIGRGVICRNIISQRLTAGRAAMGNRRAERLHTRVRKYRGDW